MAIERVTKPTREVMRALLEAGGPLHGFEIATRTQRPAATAYNVLSRLEEAGYVTGVWEIKNPVAGRPPRRFYELTPSGEAWGRSVLASDGVRRASAARTALRPRPRANEA